jgi:hypothetical protein
MYDIQNGGLREMPRNSFDMARNEIAEQRQRSKSPAKRQSDVSQIMFGRLKNADDDGRRTSAPGPVGGVRPRQENILSPYQRGSSRW